MQGCIGSGEKVGACANSSAIRVGNYKLIVGMWAACSKNNGSINPRMCAWWDPDAAEPPAPPPPIPAQCEAALESLCGKVQSSQKACTNCLKANSAKLGAAGCTVQTAGAFCNGGAAVHDNLDAIEGPFSGESQVLGSFAAPQAPSVGPPVALFNIFEDPTEHVDLSESHPEIVRQLMARLDELYGEMVAGGTTGLMPQWVPYHTCDTPDKSCARQPVPLNAAALRKGCLDVFVPGAPAVGGEE